MIKVGAARKWSHIGAAMERGMRELLAFAKTAFRTDDDSESQPPPSPPPTLRPTGSLKRPGGPARREQTCSGDRLLSGPGPGLGNEGAGPGVDQVGSRKSHSADAPTRLVPTSRCRSADPRIGARVASLEPLPSPAGPGRTTPVPSHRSCEPAGPAAWPPRFERVLVPRQSLLPGTERPSPRVQLRWHAELRGPSRPSSRMSAATTRPSTGLPAWPRGGKGDLVFL